MIRVLRELIYSNGKISVSNSWENIEIIVFKDDQIVETKSLPLSIGDNKEILDEIIQTMKGKNTLLYMDDDYTKVLSNSYKRYVIRGTDSYIHVLYSDDGSSFIKQAFLAYDYDKLSLKDYVTLFGLY